MKVYEIDKHTRKKMEIINGIVGMMDESGLKNITIKDICRVTNISVGSFYHYFQSKDSIARDMYSLMDEFFLANESNIRKFAHVSEQIISFVEHFGVYVEEWGYYGNLFILHSSLEDIKENRTYDRKIVKILKSLLQEGIDKEQFKVSLGVDDLFTMVFVIIRGYLLEWGKGEKDYPVKDKMVEHTRILMTALSK